MLSLIVKSASKASDYLIINEAWKTADYQPTNPRNVPKLLGGIVAIFTDDISDSSTI